VLNRTAAAELDFGSEANHAVSNYQTVFAAVPTVNQNQPLIMHSFIKVLEELLVFFLAESEGQGVSDCNLTEGGAIIGNRP
jgi:hypothetical protein